MKIDAGIILILLRAVRKFGARRVNVEIQRYFTQLEKSTGKDFSFEKCEIGRIIWEI